MTLLEKSRLLKNQFIEKNTMMVLFEDYGEMFNELLIFFTEATQIPIDDTRLRWRKELFDELIIQAEPINKAWVCLQFLHVKAERYLDTGNEDTDYQKTFGDFLKKYFHERDMAAKANNCRVIKSLYRFYKLDQQEITDFYKAERRNAEKVPILQHSSSAPEIGKFCINSSDDNVMRVENLIEQSRLWADPDLDLDYVSERRSYNASPIRVH